MKQPVYFLTLFLLLPILLVAQETNYSIGMRSTIITSEIRLSKLDGQFSDLKQDGISGPHFSTVYFMVRHNSYFRYGFETFTANSNRKEQTTFDIQAAGLVAEFYYESFIVINAGIQIGAAIISAMAKDGTKANEDDLQKGSHYKSEGVLFSPYIALGYRIGRFEPQLNYKPVFFSGGDENSQVDLFDAGYLGIGLRYNL